MHNPVWPSMSDKDRVLGLDVFLFTFYVMLYVQFRSLSIAFLLFLSYLLFALLKVRWPRTSFIFKLSMIYVTGILSLAILGGSNILIRRGYEVEGGDPTKAFKGTTQDGMVLSEESVQLFLEGKNPYATDFSDTKLKWMPSVIQPNPTATHYVYQPAMFILPVPFKGLIERALGYFDMRLFYFAVFGIGLLVLPMFGQRRLHKLMLAMALGLNDTFLLFLAEGRNDIMGLVAMLLAWLFLAVRRRLWLAAVFMGLACALKQSTWLMVPFFALYALRESDSWTDIKHTVLKLWPLPVVAGAFILPFFLSDPIAYIEDCFLFQSGAVHGGYPIWGVSLARYLVDWGLLENIYAPWPSLLFVLAVDLPFLLFLLWRQWKYNTMQTAWFGYGFFFLIYSFFAYFYNDNIFLFTLTCLFIAFWADPSGDR